MGTVTVFGLNPGHQNLTDVRELLLQRSWMKELEDGCDKKSVAA